MTKLFEEFIRTEVDSIEPFKDEPKGELTVVISEQKIDKKISQNLDESDKILIKKLIKKLSVKEITSLINKDKKISKKTIYNYCIKLKNEN